MSTRSSAPRSRARARRHAHERRPRRPSAAAEALAVKALSIAPEKASAICAWASSTSTPIALRKALPNLSERLRSTEISPPPTRISDWPKSLSVVPKRLRLTSRRRSGSALAIRPPIFGGAFNGSVKVFLAEDEEAVARTAPRDRGQPEFAARAFLPRRRLGGTGPARRSAARSEGGAFHRSHIHHPPLPRRRAKRQPDFLEQAQQIDEIMRRQGCRKEG